MMSIISITVLALTVAADPIWHIDHPCLEPGPAGAFDEVSVKDPTIVFHDGAWHVFYTARNRDAYAMGYVSAPTVAELNAAPHHPLETLSEPTGYAAAPQVFYFDPQGLWYLVYQTRGIRGERGHYTPMFVTTRTIGDPSSWSEPRVLVEKFERAKWIDFWVICDETTAYLFYTRNHDKMAYMTTDLDDFPRGFASPTRIREVEVHEAVCIYKIQGADEYAMIVEINKNERRDFRVSTAPTISGPWSPVQSFANGDMLRFPDGANAWTTMVSHGEFIRAGVDQRMEIPPLDQTEFLIQGTTGYRGDAYTEIVWKLGVIRNFER